MQFLKLVQAGTAVTSRIFLIAALLSLWGCRAPGDENGATEEKNGAEDHQAWAKPDDHHKEADQREDEHLSRNLDHVGDDAEAIPFGQALVLNRDETALLYPTLVAWAGSPEDLAALLPRQILGFEREELIQGVQEAETAAWMGAMGRYRGDKGSVSILVQDTAWEPTLLNPFLRTWRSESEGLLPDGRPIARIDAIDQGGRFLQVPGVSVEEPRLVLQLAGGESISDELLEALASAIPRAPIAELNTRTADRRGPYPRSSLLPSSDELEVLGEPKALLAGLPNQIKGGRLRAEGYGYQREPDQDLVSAAIRTFSAPSGVIQFSIQDLGGPNARVVVGSEGGGEGSAAWLRKALSKTKRKKARCSARQGLCKWAAMRGERWVLSLSGPSSLEGDELESLGELFLQRSEALGR